MIIIRVMGGLGNQLFQYALYELLKLKGKKVKLDILGYTGEEQYRDKRPLDLIFFQNITFKQCNQLERCFYLDDSRSIFARARRKIFGSYQHITEEKTRYMPEIFNHKNGYFQGYWNDERYSGSIETLLQERLIFPVPQDTKNKKALKKIQMGKAISIHIRRGDYLLSKNEKLFGGICTEAYYTKAMELAKKEFPNATVYVFCEDTDYVKKQYCNEKNIEIVDWNKGRDSIYDMFLMSICDCNICANSTFSIWAAKLNKKKYRLRIRPVKMDHLREPESEEIEALHSNGWNLIDENGIER